jgi:flavodoxin I
MDLNLEIDVKLIYGTETGFTKLVGEAILKNFTKTSIVNIEDAEPEDWFSELLILGIPTWCEPRLDTFGEYSDDWNNSLDKFKGIDFTGQTVALYGLGDQIGYADNFVDGLGMLAEVVIKNGGRLIGKTSTEGYSWSQSNGLADEDTFFGLPIDEDNEPTLTYPRIHRWVQQLQDEL